MPADPPKSVAAVTTVYRKWSHADVILGKLLEGYLHDGGEKPALRLASLYVDQFPKGDMSKDLAAKYGFRLCKSIPEALTRGGDELAVDGVLLIGEHGDYPHNEKGQHLYPRRKFFGATAAVFEKTGRS